MNMAIFEKPEDVLARALTARQPTVRLEKCVGSINSVIRKVLKNDRRLNAVFAGYQGSSRRKGLVQLMTDYDLTIEYQEDCPDDLNEIILDDGRFDPDTLLTPGSPRCAVIVTGDLSALQDTIRSVQQYMLSCYEGLTGIRISAMQFKELTDDVTVRVSYDYAAPAPDIRVMAGKAAFASRTIWKNIAGRAGIPLFVKPFLAYSYLMQECYYDKRAFDEVRKDASAASQDPVVHLGYGPLVEKRGICGGLAWAFKRLMDDAGVPCLCVSGFLLPDLDVGHMWNLIRLDGQYYHVDVTWGINNGGVCVRGLQKPDSYFEQNHQWDRGRYPKASGQHYTYDFIEDFLYDHGLDYIDEGANEKYIYPEAIIE